MALIFIAVPTDPTPTEVPPSIERVLNRFRGLSREDKMQALVGYAKRLEPVPDRFLALDRGAFTVPECQTRVDLFPEYKDGKLHFYADVNTRQSPTIAAFLSILFSAINDQPPETTLAIPEDPPPRRLFTVALLCFFGTLIVASLITWIVYLLGH